jgi:hypothetical protein
MALTFRLQKTVPDTLTLESDPRRRYQGVVEMVEELEVCFLNVPN